MPTEPRGDFDWMDSAACRGFPTDLWFPHPTQHGAEAKAICAGCEVREECRDFALRDEAVFGIWGGCSERQRRNMRAKVS